MTALRGFRALAMAALLTAVAFAQAAPADEFGQSQSTPAAPAPACLPAPAPRPAPKRVTAVQAMKGGAELGAMLGGMTGHKKGVMIGTVAGGVAGLIWELTAAKHPGEGMPDAAQ